MEYKNSVIWISQKCDKIFFLLLKYDREQLKFNQVQLT